MAEFMSCRFSSSEENFATDNFGKKGMPESTCIQHTKGISE
jgi:hypothetical protein